MKRKKRRKITCGENGHCEMLAVRPPRVPTTGEHEINLTRLRVKIDVVSEWLGVKPEEIKAGVAPAIRLAIAYYIDHQNAVSMRRLR